MVIVRDAAGTIRRCMDSILKCRCFDQVVVIIDSRSKDGTDKILAQYRKRFPHVQLVLYKWSQPGDFAAVRNAAIAMFKTQYGFWLDADEELIDPGAIRYLLNRANGRAFNLWIISPMRHGSFNMKQPRLFPVLSGVRFECPVFERLDFSLRRNRVIIQETEFKPIFHVGYLSAGILPQKRVRNLAIAERGLQEQMGPEQRDHLYQQYLKMR